MFCPDIYIVLKHKNKHMELFQIIGSVVLLALFFVPAYNIFKNRYVVAARDSRGVVRKRDVRNGRFVK